MTVVFVETEPNGLATMVGELIRANLERDPERQRLLRGASVGLTAPDAGVSVTLHVARGGPVTIANGRVGAKPDLRIRADSHALLELASAPLRFGFPDPLRREGRAVIRKLFAGEVRVAGMLLHPRKLARFTMLMSVA